MKPRENDRLSFSLTPNKRKDWNDMGLMGYTEDDVDTFRGTLMNVYTSGVCNTKQAQVLKKLSDFLDGLLVEGHI